MAEQVVVVLDYERDTKNNARFNEPSGEDIIGRLYLRTAEHLALGQPAKIRVTIEAMASDA